MLKRLTVAGVGAIAGLVVLAATATTVGAQPEQDPPFEVVCDNGETLLIQVPPGQGDWTPGIVVSGGDGTRVLIPFAFRFQVLRNGEVIEEESIAKQGHPPAHMLTTCTLEETFGDLTFRGEVLVLAVPPRR